MPLAKYIATVWFLYSTLIDRISMYNKIISIGYYKLLASFFVTVLFLLSFSSGIYTLFNHGFTWRILVPFITIFLISIKAKSGNIPVCKPQPYLGLFFLITALLIGFTGKVTSTIVIAEISIIVGLWSLFLYYYGLKVFLFFIGPLCYLLFMSSVLNDFFSLFNSFFRHFSANIASFLADISGHEVLLSKTEILLPNMTLNVADQCSGVNHCISLYALAIPLAILQLNRFFSILSIFVLILPVSILANGVRIFIIILYNYNRQIFIHGPGNILVTSSGFFLGLLFVLLLILLLSKTNLKIKLQTGRRNKPLTNRRKMSLTIQLPLFSSLVAGILFNYFYNINQIRDIPVYSRLSTILTENNWISIAGKMFPESVDLPIPLRNYCFKCFKIDGDTIDLYTAFYGSQDNEHEISGYGSILEPVKKIKLRFETISRDFMICRSVSDMNEKFYLINYRCGSKYTSDARFAKILTLYNAFFNHSTSASIFITALPTINLSYIENDGYLKDFLSCFYQLYELSIRP